MQVAPWNTPRVSRAPQRGFFSLAVLLLLTWASEYAEREGLRRAALTYDLGSIEAMMNVVTAIDVLLGLGVVVALLVLCLAPRSARVTLPAQLAATLAALSVLVRGGARLLLASGVFASGSAGTTFARYGGAAVTLADIAGSALLLVAIARVARAARAPVARAFAIVALVVVLVRLASYAATALVGADPGTLETLELVQGSAFLVYELLILWLCVHAGVVVTRIPDDLSA
jgi:hypothetical protein